MSQFRRESAVLPLSRRGLVRYWPPASPSSSGEETPRTPPLPPSPPQAPVPESEEQELIASEFFSNVHYRVVKKEILFVPIFEEPVAVVATEAERADSTEPQDVEVRSESADSVRPLLDASHALSVEDQSVFQVESLLENLSVRGLPDPSQVDGIPGRIMHGNQTCYAAAAVMMAMQDPDLLSQINAFLQNPMYISIAARLENIIVTIRESRIVSVNEIEGFISAVNGLHRTQFPLGYFHDADGFLEFLRQIFQCPLRFSNEILYEEGHENSSHSFSGIVPVYGDRGIQGGFDNYFSEQSNPFGGPTLVRRLSRLPRMFYINRANLLEIPDVPMALNARLANPSARDPMYSLNSVLCLLENHWFALVRRGDQWFVCDDTRGNYPVTEEQFQIFAKSCGRFFAYQQEMEP